jgi:serine/threonine protein kinase
LVTQTQTKVQFAVKAFSKTNIFNSSGGRAALINEINIMRRVDSSYSVRLEYIYETENSLYLVLELLSGGEIFKIDEG